MKSLRASGALITTLLACATQVSWAQSLDQVEAQVSALESNAARAASTGLEYPGFQLESSGSARLADAELRVVLGEYDAAAIMLVDLVDGPRALTGPAHRDALHLLAECFYETRRFANARLYYQRLVELADPMYALSSAQRLLEIAFALDEYDGLETLYSALQRERGVGDAALAYIRGKSLYHQGRYEDAVGAFALISPADERYYPGRYLSGAAYARSGALEQALEEFEALEVALLELIEADEAGEDMTELLELTALARGRVLYELERWDDAVQAYLDVSRQSKYFDEAIYELSWCFVQAGNPRRAIYNLEILDIIADNERLRAEGALIRGDLLMREESYDDAVELYRDVSTRSVEASQELSDLLESRSNSAQFFESLLGSEQSDILLPGVVDDWFQGGATVERVLVMTSDIENLRADVDVSLQILEQLETALDEENILNLIPQWESAWADGSALANQLVDVRATLVDYEADRLEGRWDDRTRLAYEELRMARREMQLAYQDAPRSMAEYAGRSEGMISAMDGVTTEVFLQEREVDSMLREIAALETLLVQQVRSGQRTRESARRAREELLALRADVQGHAEHAQSMREDLQVQELAVGAADATSEVETQLRQQYLAALTREIAFLRDRRTTTDSDGRLVDAMWARLDQVDSVLEGHFGAMEEQANRYAADFVQILVEEREAVEGYSQTLARYESESQETVVAVLSGGLLEVEADIQAVNLRANLGVIDVAWREKEAVTARISELFVERNRTLQILDADFAEVLAEE